VWPDAANEEGTPVTHAIVKLPDEPIVIVRVSGEVTAQEHYQLSLEVFDLIDKVPGRIYRINDLTGSHRAFGEMTKTAGQASQGWGGTASDPRVVSLVVAGDGNAYLGIQHLNDTLKGSTPIQLFATLEEALAYTRAQIANAAEVEVKAAP
jgi:hypothetical protein